MWQFLIGGDSAFAALKERVIGACVVFQQQPMPPGSTPTTARVGVEVRAADGTATLFVERGVQYAGPSDAARRWLADGHIEFDNFDQMRQWIQVDLKACYTSPADSQTRPTRREDSSTLAAGELTDLRAVDRQLPRGPTATNIDENGLFQQLVRRIRGQDDAMGLLAKQVHRHLARRTPRRPSTLMALGPTGVGKTASAECLPAMLQGRLPDGAQYGYLRLDMSEYQERHRISQLLGAPQGYLGYDEGAQLTNTLRLNPRTIVLFDEIEKAHPDILRALMNAMDAGRLSSASATGAAGHEIDCRRAMFIFTSNLDAGGILQDLKTRNAFGHRSAVDAVCRNRLRAAGVAPELIGRIGCFLVFRPLDREARAEIVTLAITRVAEEYGVRVTGIDPTVVADILKASPDEGFGARPDEYLIDELLGSCLAEAAAAGLEQPALVEAGPPYRCVPFDSRAALSLDQSDATLGDKPRKEHQM